MGTRLKWRIQEDRKTSRKSKKDKVISFLLLNAAVEKQIYDTNILKLKDFIMLQNILIVKECLSENALGSSPL